MQVYKLCMSIIKKNIPILSIYIFIFLGVSRANIRQWSQGSAKNDIFHRKQVQYCLLLVRITLL